MNNPANIITCSRIACAMAMIFVEPFSGLFYVLYIAAGVSDMVDGPVARKLNAESETGAKLDTIADFIFIAVCLAKLLPVLDLGLWVWIWTGIIFAVKIITMISVYVRSRQLVSVHSTINKITGLMLFILPLTAGIIDITYSAAAVCMVATAAAVHEGWSARTQG